MQDFKRQDMPYVSSQVQAKFTLACWVEKGLKGSQGLKQEEQLGDHYSNLVRNRS